MKKSFFLTLFSLIIIPNIIAQRNCNVYKWEGDTCRYEACQYLEEAPRYFQLRREFHEIYDKAIEICPDYSDAYRAKSIAYLKTGDFVSWYPIISKAVELKPEDHLSYRGWCRFQFFRDYQGTIDDLERLKALVKGDIGYSQNGMYHLETARALCYKMLGKKQKAIDIMEAQWKVDSSSFGNYDFLHLGVLYWEVGNYSKAMETLKRQLKVYPIAECYYYLAKVYQSKGQKKKYRSYLAQAKDQYQKGIIMHDTYVYQVDKVYLATIKSEMYK